jgi:hypothetical protein
MSKVVRQIGFDEGAYVAREKEDVVVGNEIIRHRLSSRVIHWAVAATFLANLVTGLPIWTPVFGWMATLVGGMSVCRIIHPWFGLGFALASLAMAVHWWTEMEMTKEERGWVGPKLLEYLRDTVNHDKIGLGPPALLPHPQRELPPLHGVARLPHLPGEHRRARHVQLDDARHGVEGVGPHPPPEVVPRAHGAREVN